MNSRASNSSIRRGHPSSLAISTNQPASPALAPAGTNLHTKRTISLEEWERKAPLSDLQVRTVAKLAKATEHVPLPLKFLESIGKSTLGTPTRPINKFLQPEQHPSRPSTPGVTRTTPATSHPLHPSLPIQTPQQFFDWFALVDRSVAHSQEAQYRAHLASLGEQLGVCDLLLNRIQEVELQVDDMLGGWRGVEEGGKNLQGACERLLEERDSLLQVVEDIGSHLEYFQELEHATRMLNHPGESLLFQPDFHYMVERVSICIEFLKGHRHYREAEIYLLRFQQCMTRAMTLIKMNFVGSLRALSTEISKRTWDSDVSSTAQHLLLYTRFRTVAAKVAPLLLELERRVSDYPDELGSLLSECHTAYFSIRKSLLVPRILEEIKGLDPARSELVELTRSGCSYLKQLCSEEFGLYREFFTTGQDQLYQYLETLCDLLYDDLRPRILHEPRLTVLCEVCTVLQALMVLDARSTTSASTASSTDASSDDEDDDGSDTEEASDTAVPQNERTGNVSHDDATDQSSLSKEMKVGRMLHTGQLLKMVLQDAQTRLFFKAQAVIQSEIRHYVPTPDDLKWPEILLSATTTPTSAFLQEKQSTSQIFQNVASLQQQDTWYPPVRRTVWVLSQLRDFVKPAIFEDIAQEALEVCRLSLISTSDLIRTQQSKALDGQLFLARHLLILKEVLSSLELDLKCRDDDESDGASMNMKTPTTSKTLEFGGLSATVGRVGGVTETLTNMLNRTTSLLPEGLFASLGVTGGSDNDLRGVKIDIDKSLRKACEDVITACSYPIYEPLELWVKQANSINGPRTSSTDNPSRSKANTATTEELSNNNNNNLDAVLSSAPNAQIQFFEALQRDLRPSVAKVKLYLDDARTVKVLLEHVVGQIEVVYERFGDAMFRMKQIGVVGGGPRGEEQVEIVSSSGLRDILRDVCGDNSLSFPGLAR